jgi:hypothetical protein
MLKSVVIVIFNNSQYSALGFLPRLGKLQVIYTFSLIVVNAYFISVY